MNSIFKSLSIALTAAILFAACNKDDNNGGDNPAGNNQQTELRLSSGITMHRAKGFSAADTQIPAGEKIHVWVDQATTGAQMYGNNVLTADGSGGLSGGDQMYFPLTGDDVNIYALHTNATLQGNSFPTSQLTHSVHHDQRTLANYAASDLLYASAKNVAKISSVVPLTFNHLLSKLQVAIVLEDELIASDIQSVTIGGTQIYARFGLNKDVMPIVYADSLISNIAIGTDVSTDFSAANVQYNNAIIVPQTLDAGTLFITVSTTKGIFTYSLDANTTFESGKKYTCHMTIGNTSVTLNTSVEDWLPGDLITGNNGGIIWTFAGETLTISGNGAMPDYGIGNAPWYSHRHAIETILMAEGITNIGNYAFSGCNSFTEITIPNSVTSIGSFAFDGCSGLAEITIPNGVTSIGEYAFYGCGSLAEITIPNSVTSIGNSAFNSCSGLAEITIPNSVTSIGSFAFSYCSLAKITIPNSVTSISDYAFYGCSSLTSIDVAADNPNYTSENGILFNKLKNILVCYPKGKQNAGYTIPNSVTSIGYGAFAGCSSLAEITIPNSVTSIGNEAFSGCTGLTGITVEATVPPIYNSDSFLNVNSSIPVYVPAASLQAYKEANVWKDFTNLQGI